MAAGNSSTWTALGEQCLVIWGGSDGSPPFDASVFRFESTVLALSFIDFCQGIGIENIYLYDLE